MSNAESTSPSADKNVTAWLVSRGSRFADSIGPASRRDCWGTSASNAASDTRHKATAAGV